MKTESKRTFYFNFGDWTWWVWTATAILITVGLAGRPEGYLAAMALTIGQLVFMLVKEKSLVAFPVQLRLAYLALLIVCYQPALNWLYWWPMLGTFALVIFGYCLLARVLSLLPWNSTESYSLERLKRTFFSVPDPIRAKMSSPAKGCAGGLCSIAAQVPPKASF
jgi:hypothetical protein